MKSRILVIDDEAEIRRSVRMILEYEGYEVLEASSGPEGVTLAERESPDLVFLDIKMPGMDGLDALQRIKASKETLPVVIISGHGTVSTAVEATKAGAFDFIEKPLASERVLVTIRNALDSTRLRDENTSLKRAVEVRHQMVGESAALRQVWDAIKRAAPTNATVLLLGESGSGKELVARAIHTRSSRKDRPFVKVNCAALPAELLESELFGHEKGSFTGAVTTRIGKFEQADTGTIFLDEIGEMKPALQAKLLHVLQDAQFTKLGSNKPVNVDVRVVAATNRDLEAMMARGEFREDLYYRLKVIEVTVPALRERRGEILHLTEFFMDRYARRYNRPIRQLSAELSELFLSYEWPGNIRELENMMKRLVILQDEQLVIREIARAAKPVAAYASAGAGGSATAAVATSEPDEFEVDEDVPAAEEVEALPPPGSRLADVAKAASVKAERALIEDTLQQVRWNRRRAAEQLGVSYKTLLNKIKECGISRR